MPGGSHRWTRRGRGWVMTRSELQAVAAALARMDAALDRCLLLARWRQPLPPPPTLRAAPSQDQGSGGKAHG